MESGPDLARWPRRLTELAHLDRAIESHRMDDAHAVHPCQLFIVHALPIAPRSPSPCAMRQVAYPPTA